MHHALRKGPRFYKKTPPFFTFFYKKKHPAPIYFLPTALALHNLLYALTDSRLLSMLADYAKQGPGSCRASVRLSVRPFVPSFGCRSPLCGGFAAAGPAGRRHRSTAAAPGTQQQRRRSTALTSKCEQCRVYSRRIYRKLNADLLLC